MQVTHKNGIEEGEENIFRSILYKYLPYWPLFLALTIVASVGAWVYLRYATPIYETTAAILVKDEKKGVDDANLMEQLDLFGSKKLVENEIEVLKSRILMQQVVKTLNLYSPTFAEGKIASIPAYIICPITVEAKQPDSLAFEPRVRFTYDATRAVVISGNRTFHLNEWVEDSLNTVRFVLNKNFRRSKEAHSFYYSIVPVTTVVEGLVNGLKVTQATKLSSVIDLKLTDAVPQRAEDILNNLINFYNKAAIDDKNAQAANTLKFVNERLLLVSQELDSVEQNVEKYKTSEGIVDLSAQGQMYLDNVGLNDQKLSEMNVQIAMMDKIEAYVRSKNNQPGIVPASFGVDNSVLSGLLSKLYDLEAQYEGLKKTTAENNPVLVGLQSEIEKFKPSILENVKNQREILEASKKNLEGNTGRYASVLKKLPKKERGLIEISRQQSIKNGIFSFLLQKREETALAYNSAVSDTRLIDNAESGTHPVSPKRSLVVLAALALAFVLGGVAIAVREVFNQQIVFRAEIEQMTTIPVIAEIMQNDGKEPIVVGNGKRTVIAEQFRELRTSLAYIGVNNRKKKLLVTSSIGGEGKSFVTGNLAVSLSLTDKKVILIELDLRKPKLCDLFGVTREVGLTNYLIGSKEPDHIIKNTAFPNLFIIPSGVIPPNPTELILNGKLEELLKYLESLFDYIIIDTTPVGPVTDPYLLSPLCDATLYIVRHGVTPRNAVQMLNDKGKVKSLKNLAIVFNGVKSRGIGKYGYGLGYGYGYTGSYGYAEDEPKKTAKTLWGILGPRK